MADDGSSQADSSGSPAAGEPISGQLDAASGPEDTLPGPPPISASRRKQLQNCFEHGRRNVASGDLAYAIQMFAQCVTSDPGNLLYAQSLIETLHKKYNNKKKAGTLAGFRTKSLRSAMKKAIAKGEWKEAAKAGTDALQVNPWDPQVLLQMSEIATAAAEDETLLYYLKLALDTNPKDPDMNRRAGKALARVGAFDQAIMCWHRVEKAVPNDTEAPQMISQLTVDRQLFSSGVDSQGNRVQRQGGAKPETSSPAAEGKRSVKLSDEQRLRAAINKQPEETAPYRELAQLMVGQEKLQEAEKLLAKALAASGGGDLQIRHELEDVQLLQARRQREVAERRAASDGGEEAVELAKRMKSEQYQKELAVFAARHERDPQNVDLLYQFAVRLKRVGKFAEAASQFATIPGDHDLKPVATLELGECHQQQRQYAEAMAAYRQAIALAHQGQDQGTEKMALYRAGVLATGLKQYEAANQDLRTLLQLDPDYKDARLRLDKLASNSDSG